MYRVRFIDDADLPVGHDWALVFYDSGDAAFLVKRSALSERLLSQAWAVSVEQQRRRRESSEFGPLIHQRGG